jgi:hypothetical protein
MSLFRLEYKGRREDADLAAHRVQVAEPAVLFRTERYNRQFRLPRVPRDLNCTIVSVR